MDLNQAIAPVRPLTQLIGTLLIIVGLLKFGGLNIPINVVWWELGLAGWLCKQV